MAQIGVNELKAGIKIEIEGEPYNIVSVTFTKPGKGQAFTRTKLKHLVSGRVIEKTYKSNDKIHLADVEKTQMRMVYRQGDSIVFMDDKTYDQITVPLVAIDEKKHYIIDDVVYDLIFYKGSVIDIIPPIFLNMTVVNVSAGVRGDTASGRVLKPATTNTGAIIQVPIFIDVGEVIKVDTRTGGYVSRVKG